MGFPALASAARREFSAARQIPYAAHVAPEVVSTVFGDYVQVFRLRARASRVRMMRSSTPGTRSSTCCGATCESPGGTLGACDPPPREDGAGGGGSGFAAQLERKYRERLAGETLMVNELYLSTVYRPTAGLATG